MTRQNVIVIGAGPVGALAALYAANRGDNVEVYELRAGKHLPVLYEFPIMNLLSCQIDRFARNTRLYTGFCHSFGFFPLSLKSNLI